MWDNSGERIVDYGLVGGEYHLVRTAEGIALYPNLLRFATVHKERVCTMLVRADECGIKYRLMNVRTRFSGILWTNETTGYDATPSAAFAKCELTRSSAKKIAVRWSDELSAESLQCRLALFHRDVIIRAIRGRFERSGHFGVDEASRSLSYLRQFESYVPSMSQEVAILRHAIEEGPHLRVDGKSEKEGVDEQWEIFLREMRFYDKF